MTAGSPERWMRVALTLARRGLGVTWPNPAVGCVIVRDGRVLGRGWTQPGGRPHAERMALDHAAGNGVDVTGAEVFVTLEPCAHHGRTPPCAPALAEAGIARVYAPFEDPDPRVSGRGFKALSDAGVDVRRGLLADEAAEVVAGFFARIATGRPHVTLKMASTLDGRIATATGESRWITGPEARRQVHLMRAESDALLIGAGAARIDDPALDVREIGLADRSPVPVIADGRLSIPLTGRLVAEAEQRSTIIFVLPGADPVRRAAFEAAGVRIVDTTANDAGDIDLVDGIRKLGEMGVTRLLCEGGGRVAASLLRAGLVDELAWFSAGMAIGDDGYPAISALGLQTLSDAPRFDLAKTVRLGADLMTTWRPAA